MGLLFLINGNGETVGRVEDAPDIEAYPLVNSLIDLSRGEHHTMSLNIPVKRRGMYKLTKHISKSLYGSNNFRRMHHMPMFRRRDRRCMHGL